MTRNDDKGKATPNYSKGNVINNMMTIEMRGTKTYTFGGGNITNVGAH